MSRFFLDRPNLAWVVALFISLAGILAIPYLPVEKYPEVAPPQVAVNIVYPGASATLLNDSVVSLIEEELNGAKGLLYYESSSSSNGTAEIKVTFSPDIDSDMAQVDVQNRVNKAEARLPQAVRAQGIEVEQVSESILLVYDVGYKTGSEGKDPQLLADLAARNINNEIRRIPGVGKVSFYGAESAMRVWVDPQKLLSYDLSITDVNSAIAAQSIQIPAGSFGDRPGIPQQEIMATLNVQGMLSDPEEFGRIILRADTDGSTVHLSDVARIEIGPENYNSASWNSGRPTAGASIQLAPGENALKTVKAVRERLNELSAALPDDVVIGVSYDMSRFVEVAIDKVIQTLLEAVVLVSLVMFLFLQNFRYTIIPTIVVPICLFGTLGIMYAIGYSINMMTLFGMVLAIGILVDDAIVVIENVERIMVEEGLSPYDATAKAMKQISGAIIGITLVLAAVFLPLAFMGGSVGIIYRQFSMTVAVSVLMSGVVALTMTPALCATILKPVPKGHHEEKKGFFGAFNRFFTKLSQRYEGATSKLVTRTGRVMLVYTVLLAALGYTYMRLPDGFIPSEDQGAMIVSVQLPPGASFSRTHEVIKSMDEYLISRPTMSSHFSVIGFSFSGLGQNAGIAFAQLKDWSERGEGESVADEVMAANAHFGSNQDGILFAVEPPPVDGLGNVGGFALRLQDRGNLGRAALGEALGMLLGQANASPAIAYAMLDGLPDAPQLNIDIDRLKAQALGVRFDDITTVLSSAFGSSMITDFVNKGRVQQVVVQASAEYRNNPSALKLLYVPNAHGDQVPLTSLVKVNWEIGPVQVVRYNGFPSFKIMGDRAPGYSSGEAMAELERILQTMPPGIGYEWTGLSYQEKLSGAQVPMLFSLALLVVFLLLVALYESWSIPLSVMLIIPIGALGAVSAVTVLGMSNDVFFKVGLITTIALSSKNAILIVEFAKELYEQGHSLRESVTRAARMRFRPIMMTALTFIIGVIPLSLATGAGAAGQRSLGTGVIGGMVSSTVLGILFAPVFFVWVLTFVERYQEAKAKNLEQVNA